MDCEEIGIREVPVPKFRIHLASSDSSRNGKRGYSETPVELSKPIVHPVELAGRLDDTGIMNLVGLGIASCGDGEKSPTVLTVTITFIGSDRVFGAETVGDQAAIRP